MACSVSGRLLIAPPRLASSTKTSLSKTSKSISSLITLYGEVRRFSSSSLMSENNVSLFASRICLRTMSVRALRNVLRQKAQNMRTISLFFSSEIIHDSSFHKEHVTRLVNARGTCVHMYGTSVFAESIQIEPFIGKTNDLIRVEYARAVKCFRVHLLI